MILIADSGSTKTDWVLVDKKDIVYEYQTAGINPYFQSTEEIVTDLKFNLIPQITRFPVEALFFYGAGCAFSDKQKIVANALNEFYKNIPISIESDLTGAARSLCQESPGIVSILGTGSNSCFYDGGKIVKNVSPLGFILGDEGSGAVLGRQLASDCLKNQLPQHIIDRFFKRFDLTPAEILDKVYKEPFPNRFLATLTPFLREELAEPEIFQLVYSGFSSFLKRNIKQYAYTDFELHCVGSVAYYFENILRTAAIDEGLRLGKIEKTPMKGLIAYHRKKY